MHHGVCHQREPETWHVASQVASAGSISAPAGAGNPATARSASDPHACSRFLFPAATSICIPCRTITPARSTGTSRPFPHHPWKCGLACPPGLLATRRVAPFVETVRRCMRTEDGLLWGGRSAETHGSLQFQAVFEHDPRNHPIVEHLNDNGTLPWQRSLMFISSSIAGWGMNAVFWAVFWPRVGKTMHCLPQNCSEP